MTEEQYRELKRLAYEEVSKPIYQEPTATPEDEIKAMIEKRDLFHDGTLADIPHDLTLRTEMHDEINADIDALIAENARIIAANRAARDATDLAYENALEAFMESPANIQRAADNIAQRQRDSQLGMIQWQLSQLLQAYQAAQMLGDETAMAENRTAYQTLLEEYNTLLGAAS